MSALHSAPNTQTQTHPLLELSVGAIRPSPLNPRKAFDQPALEELADSIREHGLMQPVVVRPDVAETSGSPRAESYTLIAGERRWRAAQLAGRETIPAIVRYGVDDAEHLRLALLENLQRQDLDPIEEAEGYAQLNRVLGLKQSEIAAAVRRSQPVIANRMRLLKLPEDVRERIRRGELTPAHGIALASYAAFPALASKLAAIASERGWRAKELEGSIPQAAIWQLVDAGLLRPLYQARFDRSCCERCPFGAYRTQSFGDAHCLKPEHFDELQEQVLAAERARLREQRQQAGLPEPEGDLPSVRRLAPDSFAQIDDIDCPQACTEACPCRGAAIGYDGVRLVSICTDPARYRQLKAAETRARTKGRREQERELLQRVAAAMATVQEVGTAELVVLAVAALVQIHKPAAATEAAKRHARQLEGDKFASYNLRGERFPSLAQLAETNPAALIRLAVDAVLSSEVRDRFESEYAGSKSPWTDWYLAQRGTLAQLLADDEAAR